MAKEAEAEKNTRSVILRVSILISLLLAIILGVIGHVSYKMFDCAVFKMESGVIKAFWVFALIFAMTLTIMLIQLAVRRRSELKRRTKKVASQEELVGIREQISRGEVPSVTIRGKKTPLF